MDVSDFYWWEKWHTTELNKKSEGWGRTSKRMFGEWKKEGKRGGYGDFLEEEKSKYCMQGDARKYAVTLTNACRFSACSGIILCRIRLRNCWARQKISRSFCANKGCGKNYVCCKNSNLHLWTNFHLPSFNHHIISLIGGLFCCWRR